MSVRKLCILYCAFFLLCGICHGQTEKDFMDYYQQYRMVKSHDHSLLLELPIAEPFVSYAMKLFYLDEEVDILKFHNRSPKKYIVKDSCRFVSLEDAKEKGYTLPEYAFVVECGGATSGESGVLEIYNWIKLQGERIPHKILLVYVDGSFSEIRLDNEEIIIHGYNKIGDCYIHIIE